MPCMSWYAVLSGRRGKRWWRGELRRRRHGPPRNLVIAPRPLLPVRLRAPRAPLFDVAAGEQHGTQRIGARRLASGDRVEREQGVDPGERGLVQTHGDVRLRRSLLSRHALMVDRTSCGVNDRIRCTRFGGAVHHAHPSWDARRVRPTRRSTTPDVGAGGIGSTGGIGAVRSGASAVTGGG